MDIKWYTSNCVKTESKDFVAIQNRLTESYKLRLLHAAMGMVTETGEFVSELKKHVFYGKDLDWLNLFEEIGDLFWYIAVALDALNCDWETVMEMNVRKLQQRYKRQEFSGVEAISRDVVKEIEEMKRGE